MFKKMFFLFFVRPLVLLISGVYVRNKNFLPLEGPCIIVANHNSHLDTLVLLSLFPVAIVHKVRPVAAVDYFMQNPLMRWFSQNCIGIIPLQRKPDKKNGHPLQRVYDALHRNEIVILFPEGSRGEPEAIQPFKNGITHLAKEFSHVPVIPVALYGAGKSLPKGEALFVPFVIDVIVSPPLFYDVTNEKDFSAMLQEQIEETIKKEKQKESA